MDSQTPYHVNLYAFLAARGDDVGGPDAAVQILVVDGEAFVNVCPEDFVWPTQADVAGWVPGPFFPLAAKIQSRLAQREFERTGTMPGDGAVPRSRAYAAAAMLLGAWGYPSDLTAAEAVADLAILYADPSANTSPASSDSAKKSAVQYLRVMREGARFGAAHSDKLGAYERTASPAIRQAIQDDASDWLALPCGPWQTVKAMFAAVLI